MSRLTAILLKLLEYLVVFTVAILVLRTQSLFLERETIQAVPLNPSPAPPQIPPPRLDAHISNKSLADLVDQKVRVFVMVMTAGANHATRVPAVQATWARRLPHVFVSDAADDGIPTLAIRGAAAGRAFLWTKVHGGLRYLYKHHLNDAEWFMKTDDDAYIIAENLKFLLLRFNSSEPLLLGCNFYLEGDKNREYPSGPAEVLSKEALRRIVEIGMPQSLCAGPQGELDDVLLGDCVKAVGGRMVDTRDSEAAYRFLPFVPSSHLNPGPPKPDYWYNKYIVYPQHPGLRCCGDLAVSFHYISPPEMLSMEYYVYHLRPFGVDRGEAALGIRRVVSDEDALRLAVQASHKEIVPNIPENYMSNATSENTSLARSSAASSSIGIIKAIRKLIVK